MQSRAKIWIISAALGVSGCAGDGLNSERDPGKLGPNSHGGGAGTHAAGSGGQADKGGAGASLGGNAGYGSSGAGGTSGASGAGGSSASAGLAFGGGNAAAGTGGTTLGPSADCPSLTRARLPSGACVDRITEFAIAKNPTSIVTGSDGQVWFDDDSANQLVQLDSAGRVLKRLQFDQASSPRALVGGHDDALIWYTDAGARTLNRVTETSHANFALSFTPTALALGENDELWLAEAGRSLYRVRPPVSVEAFPVAPSNVLVFGPDKNLWFSTPGVIASLKPAQGTLYMPTGASLVDELCAGPDGALWFTDASQSQIGRIELRGRISTFDLPAGSRPTRLIVGPDGALWFTAPGAEKIGRITLTGQLTQYPIPTSGGSPYALTVGGDGNIWFTEKASGKIGRLIPDPLR